MKNCTGIAINIGIASMLHWITIGLYRNQLMILTPNNELISCTFSNASALPRICSSVQHNSEQACFPSEIQSPKTDPKSYGVSWDKKQTLSVKFEEFEKVPDQSKIPVTEASVSNPVFVNPCS